MVATTKPPRPANKLEMRAFYTGEIAKLLAQRGQMTRAQIATELGINENTLCNYLAYMRDELHQVRHSGERLNGRPMWEIGVDTSERKKCESVEDLEEQQNSVPARQVGMWRDALVAALFGPARDGAAAC